MYNVENIINILTRYIFKIAQCRINYKKEEEFKNAAVTNVAICTATGTCGLSQSRRSVNKQNEKRHQIKIAEIN